MGLSSSASDMLSSVEDLMSIGDGGTYAVLRLGDREARTRPEPV